MYIKLFFIAISMMGFFQPVPANAQTTSSVSDLGLQYARAGHVMYDERQRKIDLTISAIKAFLLSIVIKLIVLKLIRIDNQPKKYVIASLAHTSNVLLIFLLLTIADKFNFSGLGVIFGFILIVLFESAVLILKWKQNVEIKKIILYSVIANILFVFSIIFSMRFF